MLLVADNVINTFNYSNLLTTICKQAPVFVVKVSRPYFLTRPQGAREKFGVWGRDYLGMSVQAYAATIRGERAKGKVGIWGKCPATKEGL